MPLLRSGSRRTSELSSEAVNLLGETLGDEDYGWPQLGDPMDNALVYYDFGDDF